MCWVTDHGTRNATGGYIRLYAAEPDGYTNGVWRAEGDDDGAHPDLHPAVREDGGAAGAPPVSAASRVVVAGATCARSASCRCGCTRRDRYVPPAVVGRSRRHARHRRAVPRPRRRRAGRRPHQPAPRRRPRRQARPRTSCSGSPSSSTTTRCSRRCSTRVAGAGRRAAAVRPGRAAAEPDGRGHHVRLRRARLRRLGLEPRLLPGRLRAARVHPPVRGRHVDLRRARRGPGRRSSASTTPGSPPSGSWSGTASRRHLRRAAADPARDAQRELRPARLLHRDLRRAAGRADRRPGVPARRALLLWLEKAGRPVAFVVSVPDISRVRHARRRPAGRP